MKDLEGEIVKLKKQLDDYNSKLDTLHKKYEYLEKKFDDCIKKETFKCNKCADEFENMSGLRNHMKSHKSKNDEFECNMCDNYFDEEWKMSAHIRNHNKYVCDICEKTFKSGVNILRKRINFSGALFSNIRNSTGFLHGSFNYF